MSGFIRVVVQGGRVRFLSALSGVLRQAKGSVEVPLDPGPSAKADEPEVGAIPAATPGTGPKPDRELSQHWT